MWPEMCLEMCPEMWPKISLLSIVVYYHPRHSGLKKEGTTSVAVNKKLHYAIKLIG